MGTLLGAKNVRTSTSLVSTLPLVETEDRQAVTNLSDGVCSILRYREVLNDNNNGGEEFKRFGLNYMEELETARIVIPLTQNNRKTTQHMGQTEQRHSEGSRPSRKTIRDTQQAEQKQKGFYVSHEKHNISQNAVDATEPATDNLELPTPADKGTDRHVGHVGENLTIATKHKAHVIVLTETHLGVTPALPVQC